MPRYYIGADLSKDWIDIYHPQQDEHRRIANNAPSISAFLQTMQQHDILIFEATSGCDDILLAQIRAEDTVFVRVNPAHAWHFSRACNLPKTDRVDARMLSAFGAARQMEPQQTNTPARDRLRALVKRRRQYKDMETQEKNRLRRIADPELTRDIQSLLAILERRVAKLEKQISQQLSECEELHRVSSLLASAPGIGPVSASVLVADMPELGSADRRQIVSLAGLAPRAYESGKFKGKRRLADGRRHVRKVLYMAALSVMAQGRYFQPFIKRMKAEGKANKAIVMAIARKLLTILNTLVSQQQPFDPEKFHRNAIPQ
ncbi:IS110 family transposase [Hyphomicrobium sp.]|uniref:IS110 family transposase n=1 Tax=Hyphomicrobium sp. TaxID=82 RepID=UPI002FE019D6